MLFPSNDNTKEMQQPNQAAGQQCQNATQYCSQCSNTNANTTTVLHREDVTQAKRQHILKRKMATAKPPPKQLHIPNKAIRQSSTTIIQASHWTNNVTT
ncbi:hypothetical protein HJC23_000530 [Cyclotella cryptica]|uniref:Uncharacterized protein n=1 Tax=Cyclotella cryptica TaxID=29204 RepID=A0ABD3NL57_9STRA